MKVRMPLIAGNWKMNKMPEQAVELVTELKRLVAGASGREILVCPPFVSLVLAGQILKNSNIKLGAQNMYFEKKGAFTGEISPDMLKSIGCDYVIIGHSERRQYFCETDSIVNKKMHAAFTAGLTPIVCVGETLEQRENNEAFAVTEQQLKTGVSGLAGVQSENLVIAYEPIWAIGTGKTATSAQAQEMHLHIRKIYSELYGETAASAIRILYGGSVKSSNVSEIMSQPDVDGCLVGGASLEAEEFSKIVRF